MNCPLCDTVLESKADRYYFICSQCGAYVKDKQFYISSEEEKLRYEEHNNDVDDPRYRGFTSPVTNAILGTYQPVHSGLDYGCGTGPVISKVLRENNYNVRLYDPYFYPDTAYLNYKYDYIFSCEVFEHFHHPRAEIEKIMRLLHPGGRLYIMTHIYKQQPFENWYYRNDPTHVFIYTEQTIHYIAGAFGLALIHLDERLIIFRKPG